MQPLRRCLSIHLMLLLINHRQQLFLGILNLIKPLIGGKQIQLMNLLILERNLNLVDDVTNLVHVQKRVVYLAFV